MKTPEPPSTTQCRKTHNMIQSFNLPPGTLSSDISGRKYPVRSTKGNKKPISIRRMHELHAAYDKKYPSSPLLKSTTQEQKS